MCDTCHDIEYYAGGLTIFEASLTKNNKFSCFSILIFLLFDEENLLFLFFMCIYCMIIFQFVLKVLPGLIKITLKFFSSLCLTLH